VEDNHGGDKHIHPDKLITYTASKTAAYRYQLVDQSCHVLYMEIMLHTQGTTPAPVTVKFFTADDPGTPASDVNTWNLTCGAALSSAAWTPDLFKGVHFRNGVFAEVMSEDTAAKVTINMLYVLRNDYHPAFEAPSDQIVREWNQVSDDEPYDGFIRGYVGDSYDDTSTDSTPGEGTGTTRGMDDS